MATDAGALRNALFELERGVCRKCSLNCGDLLGRLRAVGPSERTDILSAAAPRFFLPEHEARLARLMKPDFRDGCAAMLFRSVMRRILLTACFCVLFATSQGPVAG